MVQKLGTDGIWLLNNDCVVSRDSLFKLHDVILNNSNVIVGSHIKYYYEPNRFQAVGGGELSKITGRFALNTNPARQVELNYIHGASIAFSLECLCDVGFFDEKIFMYCEEVDFCLRAAYAGYKFSVLPIEIFHKEGGSQGVTASVNAWEQVLINKYYVLKKNLGWGIWVIFYFLMLIVRSLLPIGLLQARLGARRVLCHIFYVKKHENWD